MQHLTETVIEGLEDEILKEYFELIHIELMVHKTNSQFIVSSFTLRME